MESRCDPDFALEKVRKICRKGRGEKIRRPLICCKSNAAKKPVQ